MDKFFLYTTTVFLLFVLVGKIYKQKYSIVHSLPFWFVFFYFCYIDFSCIFIDAININWKFSNRAISFTRYLISFYNFIFAYFYLFLGKKISFYNSYDSLKVVERQDLCYKVGKSICFIGFFVLLYCIYKVFVFKQGKSFVAYNSIRSFSEKIQKSLHIRFFLYLLVSSSYYLFLKDKKVLYLLPCVLIFALDFLSGTRTLSFIVLIYLYIIYVIFNKQLALKFIIPLLIILLAGAMVARNKFLNGNEAKLGLNIVFGEFFETFTTIPYVIDNSLLGEGFLLERILTDFTFGSFIPGSVRMMISGYESVGEEIARFIGRGYGLGSNFITESIFEFGIVGVVFPPIYFILFVFIDWLLRKPSSLIVKIIFVFQMRLFIREGICQLTIALYIFIVYFAFFYFQGKYKKQYLFRYVPIKRIR